MRALLVRDHREPARRATSSDPTTQVYTKESNIPNFVIDPPESNYHEDRELERYHERYELARNRVTVSDVLSEVDHLIADEHEERKHPLYTLAKHVLRHGGFRSSGRHAYVAEQLGMVFESLIEDAIERLVNEELASGVSWED